MAKPKPHHSMTREERQERDAARRAKAVRSFLRERGPAPRRPSAELAAVSQPTRANDVRALMRRLADEVELLESDERKVEVLQECFGVGAADTLKRLRRYAKGRGRTRPE